MMAVLLDVILLASSAIVLLASLWILRRAARGEVSVRTVVAALLGFAAARAISLVWSAAGDPQPALVSAMGGAAVWIVHVAWQHLRSPTTPRRRATDLAARSR
ncbi:hypothetical protein [Caldimonas taiwanensis]|uniref:hypothetical protein n=1 Tax=Caldimonas taiwanensis TaxID=307483 RepID=UPI0007860BB9|nr:hypothetical protein [Caldimonas taiwanensis]